MLSRRKQEIAQSQGTVAGYQAFVDHLNPANGIRSVDVADLAASQAAIGVRYCLCGRDTDRMVSIAETWARMIVCHCFKEAGMKNPNKEEKK